jgi:hypothetical protein
VRREEGGKQRQREKKAEGNVTQAVARTNSDKRNGKKTAKEERKKKPGKKTAKELRR